MASASIIPATWQLPPEIATRLSPTSYGKQRAIVEGKHVLLVLHRPPKPNDEREGILFWRNAKGEWTSSRPSAGGIRHHIQAFTDREVELSNEFEKAGNLHDLFALLDILTPLTRAGRNMYVALQNARDGVPEDGFLIEMRDQAYEVDRNLELLLEDVRNAIQYRMVRDNEEQAIFSREAAVASHRLTILAALTFPLTAIGSIFGMNISSGLEGMGLKAWIALMLVGVAAGFGTVLWVLAPHKVDPGRKAKFLRR